MTDPKVFASRFQEFPESFAQNRTIPSKLFLYTDWTLDKRPGLRPIGVGEVLQRIIGEVKKSVGSLQVCAGQEAGCEAAIHAMRNIYQHEDTEAVLLIDSANAFNSINCKAFDNIGIICPGISTYVENCYNKPSRLFVTGGVEVSSTKGTTQGDPITMTVYEIAAIVLF